MKKIYILSSIAVVILIVLLVGEIVKVNNTPDYVIETPPEIWNATTTGAFSFKYPETLPTKYIKALDWPPKIQVIKGPFTCTEAGDEVQRAGRTEIVNVDERTYCVTKITEGAAGSIYTQYAYTFEYEKLVLGLTFSTKAVQCGNYNDPEKSECEFERKEFMIDGLIHQIVGSINIENSVR